MRNLMTATALVATLASGLPALAQPGGFRGGGQQGAQGPQAGPGGIPAGSYQRSCRNQQVAGKYMTAECRAADGRWAFSRLPYADCRADIQVNPIGIMTCGAIVADSGRYVDNGGNGGGRNDSYGGNGGGRNDNYGGNGGGRNDNYGGRRRDDNGGSALAGALAGALIGGGLAGNLAAAPPPPPPAYGDPRYGDPRYDWRYQQGGFGYGHRPGEWIPISQRADWLNREIDHLQRDGRIDFRDARDYRRQLSEIQNRERDLMGFGRFGPRQRDELDHRFNDLTEEIRRDARED